MAMSRCHFQQTSKKDMQPTSLQSIVTRKVMIWRTTLQRGQLDSEFRTLTTSISLRLDRAITLGSYHRIHCPGSSRAHDVRES